MRKLKLNLFTIFTIFSMVTVAQEEKEENKREEIKLEIIADSYFRTNINSVNNDTIANSIPSTSFANKPGFSLGMINAIATYTTNKVTIVGDIVSGPKGKEASNSVINQLYVNYNAFKNVSFTLGKFNTYSGYEVISPKGNFNYSTSYLFSNGPFSHAGLKTDIQLSKNHGLMLAIMNANDDTEFNSIDKYTFGLQYSYKNHYFNFTYGDQDAKNSTDNTFLADYTGGIDINNKLYIGINAAYQTTKNKLTKKDNGFVGTALYLQYIFNDKVAIGIRPEYFRTIEENQKDDTFATTLSGNINLSKNLTLIPEFRIDTNKNKPFVDQNLKPQQSLSSFLIGAVYNFNKSF